MACDVDLAESQLVMVLVVEDVQEIRVKRMDVLLRVRKAKHQTFSLVNDDSQLRDSLCNVQRFKNLKNGNR